MTTAPIQRLTSKHGRPLLGTSACRACGKRGLILCVDDEGRAQPVLVHADTDERHDTRCPGVPQPAAESISEGEALHYAHRWKEILHAKSKREKDPARREKLLRMFLDVVQEIAAMPGGACCPICEVPVRDGKVPR